MENDEPCCPAAARRVKRIWLGGHQVGVIEMDKIIEEVHSMGLGDDDTLADALLERARIFNYIPPQAAAGYRVGLLEEYRRIHPRGDY
jgi:hypothetical protein